MRLKQEPIGRALTKLEPSLIELPLAPELVARLCEDHFEGDPLVPGAHLIGLAVEAGERLGGAVARVRRASFRAALRPDMRGTRVRATKRAQARSRAEILAAEGEQLALVELAHGELTQLEALEIEAGQGGAACGPLGDPEQVRRRLRHGPRALVVSRMHAALGERGREGGHFEGLERPRWHWCELLDGAAQAAGLCLRIGDEGSGPPRAVYVAAYEQLELGAGSREGWAGAPWFRVRRGRRIMGLQQFDLSVEDAARTVTLLRARVTLASAEGMRG